jgi:5'-nucleotidase / UDP-sugar diphosphatase
MEVFCMKLIRKLAFCPVILIPFLLSACAGGLQMTILHMNDSHSYIESVSTAPVIDGEKTLIPAGGLARFSTKIDAVRRIEENVLFLHAGDAVQGTLYFTKYNGVPEIEWLNRMKCDAMVTGNHEFDKGSALLADLADIAEFPILAGNIDVSADPFLYGKLLPYVILPVSRSKIGVIGLVTPDTADTSNPDETVVFNDHTESASRLVQYLHSRGVNKIIILSHIGYENDIALAASVDNIDIIIGGHTHTLLGETDTLVPGVDGPYPTIVTGPSGRPVYIVQAWAHTRAFGRLDVAFDRKGYIITCNGRATILAGDTFYRKDSEGMYTAVDSEQRQRIVDVIRESAMVEIVPEDPGVLDWIAPYREGIDELKGVVVGYCTDDILNVRIPGTRNAYTGDILEYGSELAPLIADSMLWKTRQIGLNADFAIQNAGGVRMGLPAGEITVGTVYELLPFENTICVLDISGRQLKHLLESLMERIRHKDNDGAFPYPSDLKYTADMNRPMGERITSLAVADQDGNWISIDPGTIYRVATNNYLASGKDGYAIFSECTGYRYDTGFQDAEVFMEYVETVESLSKMPETMITFIQDIQASP